MHASVQAAAGAVAICLACSLLGSPTLRAADEVEKAASTSLLQQAELDARESRFFGQQGLQRRSNSVFERARDPATPFTGGRLDPESLRSHEYGRIKKSVEDSLSLRSLSRYYDARQRGTAPRQDGLGYQFGSPRADSQAWLPSPKTSPAADLGDAAERARLAADLKAAGYDFNWREHSLQELDGIAGRIATAERLRQRGFDVDWANYSGEELRQIAERADHAEQLMQQGRRVDWTGFMRLAPPLPSYRPTATPSIHHRLPSSDAAPPVPSPAGPAGPAVQPAFPTPF